MQPASQPAGVCRGVPGCGVRVGGGKWRWSRLEGCMWRVWIEGGCGWEGLDRGREGNLR